jgi:hypothetical protein
VTRRVRVLLALSLLCGALTLPGTAPARPAPMAEVPHGAQVAQTAASDAAEGGDLDAVMSLLARRRHGRVEFIEQHFMSVLDRPLESSGEMSYDAPDRLEKRTLKPRAETLLLDGSVLTVERGHSRHVLDVHAYPQVQPFVESIRATLAGDRGALERMFRVGFTGNVQRWNLTLVPLDARVAKNIAQVSIDGAQDELRRIEIRQPDGDRSLMTLRARSLSAP